MDFTRRSFFKLFSTTLLDARRFPLQLQTGKRVRARQIGLEIGRMTPGRWNAITDVPGIKVGHSTIIRGTGKLNVGAGPARTGVTVVTHEDFGDVCFPAGFDVINGNGEVTGLPQIRDLGVLSGPIAFTNTSSVGMVLDALISTTAEKRFVPVVGETWDAFLNDIEGRHVRAEHVAAALKASSTGPVAEGNVGGGTGMICYQFKGGIGTASRKLDDELEAYTVGVLVQANHGLRADLRIDGMPVGEEIQDLQPSPQNVSYGNSILILIATDAPLLDYQLNRVARRAVMGLSKTGSISSNSSGDFAIAFSTGNKIRKSAFWNEGKISLRSVEQNYLQQIFQAVSEATDEAIINALFMAESMTGRDDHKVFALPLDRVVKILQRHGRLYKDSVLKKIANA